MRILITGGTGLLGRSLSQTLLASGHSVIVLSRSTVPSKNTPVGVRVERWDAETTKGWAHLVEDADAIVHLAGANIGDGPWTAKRKQLIRESRIHSSMAVRKAIEEAQRKPKVLVQASAVGYYGPHGDEIVTEETPAGTDFLAKVCFDWELATASIVKLGIRRPVLRTGIVLTPEGGALPKMLLPFRFFAGGPMGSGKQWMPWIHIADEARAIQFLITHESATGPFNLTAPNPVTNKQFSQTIGKVIGRPSLMPAPAFAIKSALGEMSTLVLDGQRALPQRLEELGFTFQYPTVAEALQHLLKKSAGKS